MSNRSLTWVLVIIALTFSAVVETSAQYEEPRFPIPRVDPAVDKPEQRTTPDRLRKAFQAMQVHLCGLKGVPNEEWKRRYRQLLVDLTAIEYRIVVDHAGNIGTSGSEKDAESRFFQEEQQIRRLLGQEIRDTQFSKEFFREQLDNYDRRYKELYVAAAGHGFGRGVRMIFAMGTALEELSSGLGITQMKYRTQIDGRFKLAFERLSILFQELVSRGTVEINRSRIENSVFGLVPFSPNSRDPYLQMMQWDLKELGPRIANELSIGGTKFSGSWLQMPEGPAFTEDLQQKVRGGCRRFDPEFAFKYEETTLQPTSLAIEQDWFPEGRPKRYQEVKDSLLRDWPGRGVVFVKWYQAAGELYPNSRYWEMVDVKSGKPVTEGRRYNWWFLPPGRYKLIVHTWGGNALGPVEFTLGAGELSEVEVGGPKELGRVIFDMVDADGKPTTGNFWVKNDKGEGQGDGKEDKERGVYFADLTPGVYTVEMRQKNTGEFRSEPIEIEAGQTVRVRLKLGRVIVKKNSLLNYLTFEYLKITGPNTNYHWSIHFDGDKDTYFDVTPGRHNVTFTWKDGTRTSGQVFVEEGKTVYANP